MTTPPDTRTILSILRDISFSPQQKSSSFKNILFQIHNKNQVHIIFNRPKLMNAFSFDMYFLFTQYIQKANQMDNIKYIIIRGSGGNFSSGNDLNNFARTQFDGYNVRYISQTMATILRNLTQAIVQSKKPIFALTQGKVVGFAFTQLALYDRIFASQNSVFIAPLVRIAQGPQMASSYLFPKIFGQTLAQQIIIKSKVMNCQQLSKYNFLNSYKNIQQAHQALQAHIAELEKLDWTSYLQARRLLRVKDKQNIKKANIIQCQNLVERWCNPQLPNFMMRYLADRQMRPKL